MPHYQKYNNPLVMPSCSPERHAPVPVTRCCHQPPNKKKIDITLLWILPLLAKFNLRSFGQGLAEQRIFVRLPCCLC